MRVLVVNAGSSSVKLRILDNDELVSSRDLGPPDDRMVNDLGAFLNDAGALDAVGHRVVHGGPQLTTAVLLDDKARATLDGLTELAPLHNPPALAGIDAARRLLPDVSQVACFDTAFHASLPPAASTYAVPAGWVTRWGIRRYGFHGLSCAWAARQAPQLLKHPADRLRLVICHLGAGASATAVSAGRSIDTTMGFTPLEGLVMATRCGDLDPGALLYALDHGLTTADASDALEHDSGLVGLSGAASGDMRQLLAARAEDDGAARLAIAVYLHRLRAQDRRDDSGNRGSRCPRLHGWNRAELSADPRRDMRRARVARRHPRRQRQQRRRRRRRDLGARSGRPYARRSRA
jgi:acetate kinase